jgi:GMP synthase-like glutamine amidotransferase
MRHRLLFVNCYRKESEAPLARYLAWLREGAALAGDEAEVDVADDRDLQARAGWSAVVISGSQKMVGDGEVEAGLAAFIRACRRPLLGVCYGHQVLAHAFGGLVKRDAQKHAGDEVVRVVRPHSLFGGLPPSLTVSESHEEVVARDAALGQSFELLAESGAGLVEAIAHRSLPLFGVQFHPERSGAPGVKLLANFLGVARGRE